MASMSMNGRRCSGTSGRPSANTGVMRFQVRGRVADVAAVRTPGSTDTRRTTSSKKAICCSGFEYFTVGNEMFMVSTFCASKPGSTRTRRTKLRRSSPAPVSSKSDSAT
jgi:hypothetical protein